MGCQFSSYAAYLGASVSAMATYLVERIPLFRNIKTIDSAVADFMNLMTERMTHSFPELVIKSDGWFHGPPVLLYVFESLPSHRGPDCHEAA